MKKAMLVLILAMAILLQGCVPFMAFQLGYMEAQAKYSKLYDAYKTEQENTNQQVLEFNDWLKDQPLTSNEIKVFKYRGVISPEDARDIRERKAMEQAGE